VATQTVGLYYPHQRDISRRDQEHRDKETAAKDVKPVLTAISPGRGTKLVTELATCSSVCSTDLHRWRNNLGGWVTSCSSNIISGLRMRKTVKFGTIETSSARMMHVLRLLKKSFNCGRICKKKHKNGLKRKKEHILLYALPQKPQML